MQQSSQSMSFEWALQRENYSKGNLFEHEVNNEVNNKEKDVNMKTKKLLSDIIESVSSDRRCRYRRADNNLRHRWRSDLFFSNKCENLRGKEPEGNNIKWKESEAIFYFLNLVSLHHFHTLCSRLVEMFPWATEDRLLHAASSGLEVRGSAVKEKAALKFYYLQQQQT